MQATCTVCTSVSIISGAVRCRRCRHTLGTKAQVKSGSRYRDNYGVRQELNKARGLGEGEPWLLLCFVWSHPFYHLLITNINKEVICHKMVFENPVSISSDAAHAV